MPSPSLRGNTAEPEMRPVLVVVGDIPAQQPQQVPLAAPESVFPMRRAGALAEPAPRTIPLASVLRTTSSCYREGLAMAPCPAYAMAIELRADAWA